MTETTQTAKPSPTPTSYGYCSWHRRFAEDVRLIEVIEQGSGAGDTLYACDPCREVLGLVPFADRP